MDKTETTLTPEAHAALSAELKSLQSENERLRTRLTDLAEECDRLKKGLVPDGWIIVPRKPNREMIQAAYAMTGWKGTEFWMTDLYEAMIGTAPPPAK